MASEWLATKEWGDDLSKPNKLAEVISPETLVTVHRQAEDYPQKFPMSQEGYSFSQPSKTEMKYGDFLA